MPDESRPTSPLRALADVAARIADASDLDAVMPGVLSLVASSLGARHAAIRLIAHDGISTLRWGEQFDVVSSVPLRAAGATIGTLVLDAQSDAELAPALADVMAPAVAHASTVERERRLIECVIDSLPFGLYVVDRDYQIVLWNHKRETDTLGVPREEAIGRSIFDVMTRQNADVMRGEFDEVLATNELQHFQIESRSSGERRTYRLTKIPMRVSTTRGEAGPPTHVATIGEDVTEWRAALERTAQSEKLAAIGQLAAGVMHEINNPLATIAACAETMTLTLADLPNGRGAPPGFAEYLRIIDHEVHRCRGITDGLLDFSRAKPVQRVRLGLNAVVEQTLFLLKHHARFKRYPVRLELADGSGPQVTGDPDQLTQVLMALLLNAGDALGDPDAVPDDDELRGITIRTGGDDVDGFVSVSDQGQGIPSEDLTKIFEPFYTTKGPGSGTGLGLSICYGIVRDHAGRIEVDSTLGEGTTFRVLLPAAR